jgi:predicted nucleic acid-binding Zn ribbon protein
VSRQHPGGTGGRAGGGRRDRTSRTAGSSRSSRSDPTVEARRAGWQDREATLYERKRAKQARVRADQERRAFDPSPPTDDDWTVEEPDTDGVRRISPPTPVGETLGAVVRRRGWDERLRGATAWSRWSDIVGPDLAERCEPVRIAGGTLLVRAENQVWATQLRYLTAQLLDNAERVLGPGTVREVRIVVGPLEGAPTDR